MLADDATSGVDTADVLVTKQGSNDADTWMHNPARSLRGGGEIFG